MKKNTLTLLLSFSCAAISLAVLLTNWNTVEKWRFNLSLLGFIIFGLLFLANLYVVFVRRKAK